MKGIVAGDLIARCQVVLTVDARACEAIDHILIDHHVILLDLVGVCAHVVEVNQIATTAGGSEIVIDQNGVPFLFGSVDLCATVLGLHFPPDSLFERQLEARVDPIWVLSQASEAVMWIVKKEKSDDGQKHNQVDKELNFTVRIG